jgi:hypothetical protein
MYLRVRSFKSGKKLSANRKIHNLQIGKFPRKRLGSQILNSYLQNVRKLISYLKILSSQKRGGSRGVPFDSS